MKNRWMMMVGLPLVGLLTACAPEPTVVQVRPMVWVAVELLPAVQDNTVPQ
jgi:hypothetical protein